jgi:hypothetical protein
MATCSLLQGEEHMRLRPRRSQTYLRRVDSRDQTRCQRLAWQSVKSRSLSTVASDLRFQTTSVVSLGRRFFRLN